MQWKKQGFEAYKDQLLISDHAQRQALPARRLDTRAGSRTAVSANNSSGSHGADHGATTAARHMPFLVCCSEVVNERHMWKYPYRPAVACATL